MKIPSQARYLTSIAIMLSGFAAVASATPIMRLSTATILPASAAAGTNLASTSVQVYNVGDGTLSPVVSASASWVQATVGAAASCPAGITSSSNCIPINIAFNTASLAAGTYTSFLSVSSPGAVDSPQTISVTITLVGGVPSSLNLYAAPNGGTATATIDTHGLVQAQASTATGGNWLTVALSGSGSYTFYYPYLVTATTQSGQGPGTYNGSIAISGSNTASDNQVIPVVLNVTTDPIVQLTPSSVSLIAGQDSITSASVSIANAGQGTALTVSGATPTVTSGSGWLTATVSTSGGSVSIQADATSLQPGAYQGSVALSTNAANNAALVIPVSLLVTTETGPSISFGGVVDNALGKTPLAPGDIAVAYGGQFSSAGATNASAVPLPTTLGNVQVLVNGAAAPLFYTSTGQIDFQVPYETAAGTAVVQVVNNGSAGNLVSVPIVDRVPKILVFPTAGNAPIIVNNSDGSIPIQTSASLASPLPSHPAAPGDTLVIYAIGLGQTSPVATTGAGPSASPLEAIGPPVTVTLGGGFMAELQLAPLYAGLAPNFVGLYQINVTIPTSLPVGLSGDYVSLSINVQGASTQPVQIAISQ